MFSRFQAPRVAVASAIVAAVTASTALAAVSQTYTQKFTAKRPGQRSGMTFVAAGSTQPSTVVLTMPAGTRINTTAIRRCPAVASCGNASVVGTGQATVLIGSAPLKLGVTAYNHKGGILLAVANPQGTPVVLDAKLVGAKLTLAIPTLSLSGTPLTLSKLSLTIKPLGTKTKPYVRTPLKCPSAHAWTFTGTFAYPDGTHATLTSASKCVAH